VDGGETESELEDEKGVRHREFHEIKINTLSSFAKTNEMEGEAEYTKKAR
jgi:hypothetical protein